MKKLLSSCLILLLLFTLTVGCARDDVADDTPGTDQTQDGTVNDGTGNDADTATTPSLVTDEASIQRIMSSDGEWIIIFTEDMTTDQELVLEGEFINKDANDRKIALYTQDEDRNKTASFTLTAPRLTVRSENTRLQGGTFVGDVYVEANGFSIIDAEVQGNVYFQSDEFEDTFTTTDGGNVTGTTEVQE
ncbi:hypothetical protein GC105_01605 [Alkalibaculum sp. M08DMB]|uniref:Polymer-forming cytoskeletal protein n=1 Tax=Alkalibaculum sporogenes TaxID=2655001 RepID=A0A6A7K4V1_9FIRM|nr:hypothetical protein [Alkalibaculum sporogenes]MPW24489.1 hypothetical protein [Alkalibaculum sporogenes]